jgi:DNA-binding response OmpR family regulator
LNIEKPTTDSSHPQLKILVVDDASTILTLISNLFKRKYQVIMSKSVADAKITMQEDVPDFVITDLNMPDSGGEQLVEFMKSDPRFQSIPIIVLSNSDSTSTKIKLLKMGIDDYIQKPFSPEELDLKVGIIFRRYGSNKVAN